MGIAAMLARGKAFGSSPGTSTGSPESPATPPTADPNANDGYVPPTWYSSPGAGGAGGSEHTNRVIAALGGKPFSPQNYTGPQTPGTKAALEAGPHSGDTGMQILTGFMNKKKATPIQDIAAALNRNLPVSDASWAMIGYGPGGASPGGGSAPAAPSIKPQGLGFDQSSLPYVMRQFMQVPKTG